MENNEQKNHLFIVIGGENMTPLGAIRSLGESGIKPIAILIHSQIRFASTSKYIKKLHRVTDQKEAVDLLLREYGNLKEKPFVIPTDDTIVTLLDKMYDTIKDKFYVSNAKINGRITEFMSKYSICELAKKHKLNVAKSWLVKKGEIPKDLIYPVLTKPLTPYPDWKLDYHICNNENELRAAYEVIKKDDDLLLQQYIIKVNELCLDGCVVNQGKELFIAIASTYTYILPDYYSMEMVVKNFDDINTINSLKEMFTEIGFEGIFSTEFLIDKDGKLWFLEINFRDSTWSWAATKNGMNLFLIWANGMISKHINLEVRKEIPNNYIALAEAEDFSHRVMRLKLISVFKWIKGILKADCLYDWDWKDPIPVFSYWGGVVFNSIKKRIRRGKK